MMKKKSSSETYEKAKKGVPPKPHGVDPTPFPKFPREINSDFHHSILQQRMSSIDKCGQCQQLEEKLVQDGHMALAQVQKGRFTAPDLSAKYKSYTACGMCRMLLQAWQRYFIILENMSGYIYDRKMPEEPHLVTKCPGCEDIQNKDKDYADNLKKELLCRESGSKDCRHVKFSEPGYKYDRDCSECEKVYNMWQQYIFSLTALINYYRFKKD